MCQKSPDEGQERRSEGQTTQADNVLHFFNGRGLNEAVHAEAKQFASLSYIPCWRRYMLAHNLGHELQMRVEQPTRRTSPTRAPRYELKTLGTLRHLLLRQAGGSRSLKTG